MTSEVLDAAATAACLPFETLAREVRAVLPITEVVVASRRAASAQALAEHARSLGVAARTAADPNEALPDCPLVITCTPAQAVVLHAAPRPDVFIAAVGAFTPAMVELSPELCRYCAESGTIVVDTPAARHEATSTGCTRSQPRS